MSSRTLVALTLAAAGASLAQDAASIAGDLSTPCQVAAGGLISTPFGQCANVIGLASVISASGSVVQPIDQWAQGLCAQDPCSDDAIQQASSMIQANCSSDIASAKPAALGLQTITTNFNDVKNLVCLEATANSTFCITNFLESVQNQTGTQLTIDNIESMASASGLQSLAGQLPPGTFCTDCNAAIMNQATSAGLLNSTEQSALSNAATQECGSGFGSSMPSSVKEADGSSGAGRTGIAAGALLAAGLAFFAL